MPRIPAATWPPCSANCGRPEAIGPHYASALAYAPTDGRLRYAYADYLHEAGETGLAVEILAEALHRQPDFDVAHNLMGIALYDLGRLDDAIAHFRRATEIDPLAVGRLGQSRHGPEDPIPIRPGARRL